MTPGWTRRMALVTGGAGLVSVLAGCSGFLNSDQAKPGTAWPQPRFDARRTGANPADVGPTGAGEQWSVDAGPRTSGAVITGDQVIVGGRGIQARSTATGERHWHRPSPFESSATPSYGHGLVYAGSRAILYALDIETGQRRWTHSSDLRRFHAPTVTEELVVVGTTITTFSTDFDAELIAYDPATGEEQWRAPAGKNVLPPYAPAVDGETAYVGRDRVTAIDLQTGAEQWQTSLDGVVAIADPVVVDGRVYLTGVRPRNGVPAGVVFALDAATGAEEWRVETAMSPAPVAVWDDTVFVTADRIMALDGTDGAERWRAEGNQFLTASPSVAGGQVFATGIDGTVRALDVVDGRTVWERRLAGSFLSDPAIAGETLYVGSGEGRLFALGSPSAAN